MVAYIPFRERLWCSVSEAQQFLGKGKTKIFEGIANGEIVSRREGRRRLIHVPSLIARYSPDGLGTEFAAMPDVHAQSDVVTASSEPQRPSDDLRTTKAQFRKAVNLPPKPDLIRRG